MAEEKPLVSVVMATDLFVMALTRTLSVHQPVMAQDLANQLQEASRADYLSVQAQELLRLWSASLRKPPSKGDGST